MTMPSNFVICISNEGYEASLEKGKVYQLKDDRLSEKRNFIRIIDESGEDYLFPKEYFVAIQLPKAVQEALVA
jgi:hypothetical protein